MSQYKSKGKGGSSENGVA